MDFFNDLRAFIRLQVCDRKEQSHICNIYPKSHTDSRTFPSATSRQRIVLVHLILPKLSSACCGSTQLLEPRDPGLPQGHGTFSGFLLHLICPALQLVKHWKLQRAHARNLL